MNQQARQISSEYFSGSSHSADDEMQKEDNRITFEQCDPSTLFREFAAECLELAQTAALPEKRELYLKMASTWFQMAQRWEKKGGAGLHPSKKPPG